jgi:hypothetical protein
MAVANILMPQVLWQVSHISQFSQQLYDADLTSQRKKEKLERLCDMPQVLQLVNGILPSPVNLWMAFNYAKHFS